MTQTDDARGPCPGCGSTLGPFLAAPDGKQQVICSSCGMRGPNETLVATATQRWADLATQPDPLADPRVTALVDALQHYACDCSHVCEGTSSCGDYARATLAAFNTGGKADE